MIPWLKTYARTHLVYLLLIGMAGIGFRSWLIEHDNRLLAVQQEKISEADVKARDARIADLLQQKADIEAKAAADKAALIKQLSAVKTPAQAVPVVAALAPELKPTPIPNTTQVAVEAVPLATVLTQCRVDQVDLGACRTKLASDDQIITEQKGQLVDKDTEIKALKKPRGFWKRVTGTVKMVGIGIGIGFGLAHGL